jgi:hypothetical protein
MPGGCCSWELYWPDHWRTQAKRFGFRTARRIALTRCSCPRCSMSCYDALDRGSHGRPVCRARLLIRLLDILKALNARRRT